MKHFLTLLILPLFALPSFAQELSDKEEKLETKAIEKVIQVFFEGLNEGDSLKFQQTVWEQATLVSTGKDKKGNSRIRQSTFSDFIKGASAPRDQKWTEHIWDLEIEAEYLIAQAMMDYAFYLEDEFSHCGINAMQLVKFDDGWKIISLADTRMKSKCNMKEIKKRIK